MMKYILWSGYLSMRTFDLDRFAGEGNIGHMVEQVKIYGMERSSNASRHHQ